MNRVVIRTFILLCALFVIFDIAELVVRYEKPQIPFSKAMSLSHTYFASDSHQPFTLQKNYHGQMANEYNDYNVPITTNSQGYRGKEFSSAKPNTVKRILILGDSQTFGVGMTDDHTYPAILEKQLTNRYKNIEVINAGYTDGFSPDSYYVYVKNKGLSLSPDAIVLGLFVWNDITDLSETVWDKIDTNGLPEKISSCCRMVDNGMLRNKHIAFEYRYPVLRESHVFILLIRTLRQQFHLFQAPIDLVAKREYFQGCILQESCIWQFRDEEAKTYQVIHAIKSLADLHGIPFSVVLFPVDIQLYPYPTALENYGTMFWTPSAENPEFIQKRIGENITAMNIPFIDLYPIFDHARDRGYPFFLYDAHLNVLGNQIAAESIEEFLTSQLDFLR